LVTSKQREQPHASYARRRKKIVVSDGRAVVDHRFGSSTTTSPHTRA